MKKTASVLLALFCLAFFGFRSSADVISTDEPTSGNRIYIAGNPEFYPLEYYNDDTGRYEGILPEIYETVSRKTGIQFAYISADGKNRMKELADNKQAEIVSAHISGEISVTDRISLFSYTKDGQRYTVCIGFTGIADDEIKVRIKNAVAGVSSQQWLSAAMTLSGDSHKGTPFYLYIIIAALCAALVVVIVYSAIKRRARQERDLLRMIDELTGIGNLLYFEDCYVNKINAATQSLYYMAYMSSDIDTIENYYGIEQAEEVQRFTANVLGVSCVDNDFAARIGNGVFAMCFMAPDSEQAKVRMAEIADAVNKHTATLSKENGTVFRIGIFPLGKEHVTFETALNNARQGYNAVQQNQYVCICDENVLGRAALKSRLQKSLASAIENGEFGLYLQFVYDVRRHKLIGAEVLSRWDNKKEGILSPAKYIDDMKNAGIISEFDFYIFEKTCELLQSWNDTSYRTLRLSCNFTRITMSSPVFVDRLEKIISKYSFDKNNLIVELTEDYIASDGAAAYKNIFAIKNTGCKVALDDFGNGYTSFSDLCDYPIDIIKIDRNIVEKSSDDRGGAVLAGIIRMAHDLEIEVLCEGIETKVQDSNVKRFGCDYIQGFMYSRVMPLKSAMNFYLKIVGEAN